MNASEVLYEWSKLLTDARVAEEIGTVPHRFLFDQKYSECRYWTVRGRRDGVTVIVTFHSLHGDTGPVDLVAGPGRPGVLEAFVGSGGVRIEGRVERFGVWQSLMRRFRRRAAPHPLFDEFSVTIDHSPTGRDQLSRRPLLDAARCVMRRPTCWRLAFERGVGITSFDTFGRVVPSVSQIDDVALANIDLLRLLQ